MKTLKTMMMATLMTMAISTASASTNPRNGEKGHEALPPRMEQPSAPRLDNGRPEMAHKHICKMQERGKNDRCTVCGKRDCHTHNYCPTCGKQLKKQTQTFGNRRATFGGRR